MCRRVVASHRFDRLEVLDETTAFTVSTIRCRCELRSGPAPRSRQAGTGSVSALKHLTHPHLTKIRMVNAMRRCFTGQTDVPPSGTPGRRGALRSCGTSRLSGSARNYVPREVSTVTADAERFRSTRRDSHFDPTVNFYNLNHVLRGDYQIHAGRNWFFSVVRSLGPARRNQGETPLRR